MNTGLEQLLSILGSKGFGGGDRIQATMVFEKII